MKFFTFLIALVFLAGCVTQQQTQNTNLTDDINPNEMPPVPPGSNLGGITLPDVKEFRVTIGHTFYNPSSFTVNKGQTVRFLANAAKGTGDESGFSHNHGIAIDEYGINESVTSEDTSNPKVIEFVADKAGEFNIWCRSCWDGPFGRNHPAIEAKLIV